MSCEEQELLPLFISACAKMIDQCGGTNKWDLLSEGEQAEKNAKMLEGIVLELGEKSLALMSEDEQKYLKLFIWAGCGCHKDLNTVRGRYSSMLQWYQQNSKTSQPFLLPNHDIAPVLTDITSEDDIENEVQAHLLR